MDEIGSLGLDINDFEKNFNAAIEDIKRLEPEVKKANAVLRVMESEYAKLGAKSGFTGKQIDKQREILESLGVQLKERKLDAVAFGTGIDETGKPVKTFIQNLAKVRTNIGLLFSGVALGGLIAFGKSLLNFGQQVKETSLITGTLPEGLQRIQAALSDKLTADETASALHSLYTELNQAKLGSVEAQDKLKQLGLSLEDIRDKSPDQILIQLADTVAKSTDKVETLRLITNLFGADLAAKLIPALMQGSDEIKRFGDEATVASNAQIEAANRGEKALTRWGTAIKQFFLSAAGEVERVKELPSSIATLVKSWLGIEPENLVFPRTTGSPSRQKLFGVNSQAPAPQEKAEQTEAEKLAEARLKSGEKEIQLIGQKAELAKEVSPEYEKQLRLLELQRQELENHKATLSDSQKRERAIDDEKLAQNSNAQRGVRLARELAVIEKELNETQAERGIGFRENQNLIENEIASIDKQIAAQKKANDPEAVAKLRAQRRGLQIEYSNENYEHAIANEQLRLQTVEIQAQHDAMLGLALETSVRLKYEKSIADAIRTQNYEAETLLKKQQALDLQKAKAAEHDITPAQRRDARYAEREEKRKARAEDAKQAELLRRGAAGADSFEIREAYRKRDESLRQNTVQSVSYAAQLETVIGFLGDIDDNTQKGGLR